MKKTITDLGKINQLLSRGVEDVIVAARLKKRLLSGEVLRIKLGIDPTGPRLHLGRAVALWKLREFQDLGHKVVLIIGDFTALVGDPSDKLSKRPFLTEEQVAENMKNYKKQLGLILDLDKVEWRYNSEWLSAMTFIEVAKLAESFTVQQMLARRNFKDRFSANQEISIRELLYPLMQGFDSAAVRSDLEVGGADQLFNLQAGRIIQPVYNQPPQDIMTFTMLEGTDSRKMSTSWGNVINITDAPLDMFGKLMSVVDELIIKYFYLTTRVTTEEIKRLEKEMKSGTNPRNIKARLAQEVVALYHGVKAASHAASEFDSIHRDKKVPSAMPTMAWKGAQKIDILDLLVFGKLSKSKSEARRMVEQGAVKVNEIKIKNWQEVVVLKKENIVQVGSRRFSRITI